MTIISVHLIEATASLSGSALTAERTYGVGFTGLYGEVSLMGLAGAASLPVTGDTHPDSSSIYCSSIKTSLADDSPATGATGKPGYALYQVSYATNVIEDFGTPPLERDAEIEWGGSDITEVCNTDVDNKALVNSAGDFLDPLPERFVRGGDVVITRNESANPADTVVLYSNSINSASWYGVEAGKALIGKITARKTTEKYAGSDITYWQVSYPIRFNRNGWILKPIDNGYKAIYEEDADSRHKVDDMGNVTYLPILLDGNGYELGAGLDPVIFPTAGYKLNEETNFSSLSLPNPFA